MKHVKEANCPYRGGDSGVKYLMRGPRIDWGIILLKPGEALGGHYHEQVEETFYILEGEGTLYANDQAYPLAPGDVYCLEPQDRHDIRNTGAAPLKMVFIKCPYAPEDKVEV